ncbi:aspartate/glutamate racemase family protein [Streptomyces sp. NPDC088348]|uniref:aspartate/glutamate racemase family protein n=1 Tax=Streptomyces sp. NPDC088348 TaxID=3365853 RepID=UPI003829D158
MQTALTSTAEAAQCPPGAGPTGAEQSGTAPQATRPLLGILGGMGPMATAHFYRRLIERTPARGDQEHLPVAIWADPTVPDRTEALLGRGPSPLSAMLTGVSWLTQARATCVAIPCNTAHAYIATLRTHTDVPILDMVSAALEACRTLQPALERIGVLATEGTRIAGLYDVAGEQLGLQIVHVPQPTQTRHVNRAIADVKRGDDTARARDDIAMAVGELQKAGAEMAIAACTEIPLVADEAQRIMPVLDSTSALADQALTMLLPLR